MNTEKMLKKVAPMIPAGEVAFAATKATPRGAAHQAILGGAGAVAGGSVVPALAGAGGVLGSAAAQGAGDAGRDERSAAGIDVGHSSQVLLVATDRSVLIFELSAIGRPKDNPSRLERSRLATVRAGEASLFGQKMMEIVLVTDTGAEAGFGVAKVHRRHGEAVLDALA